MTKVTSVISHPENPLQVAGLDRDEIDGPGGRGERADGHPGAIGRY